VHARLLRTPCRYGDSDERSWKERWAEEAEALFNAMTKGATSLFSWANLGGKPRIKGAADEKAGVLKVGSGAGRRGETPRGDWGGGAPRGQMPACISPFECTLS
jgi:hypothetical protein